MLRLDYEPTLTGSFVTLRPMVLDDVDTLEEIAFAPELWKWTHSQVANRHDLEKYVRTALSEREAGSSIPFVTTDSRSKEAIGSSRFMNISSTNHRVEIGCTWLALPHQRTAANTEAKLLMLTHAFESMGCIRVEFKTDVLNEKSRNAILRLGATEEGVLRRHIINLSGRLRDTVYYSILEDEWPTIKQKLIDRLGSFA